MTVSMTALPGQHGDKGCHPGSSTQLASDAEVILCPGVRQMSRASQDTPPVCLSDIATWRQVISLMKLCKHHVFLCGKKWRWPGATGHTELMTDLKKCQHCNRKSSKQQECRSQGDGSHSKYSFQALEGRNKLFGFDVTDGVICLCWVSTYSESR
ncbi:hypothetical protein GRJ2_002010000 [Grus japonensis]|uniref:Uncharacterized protein n=1 Tax=Grus japonensis TaxID=30415 RepID=A0ABC9XFH4_GRUJA